MPRQVATQRSGRSMSRVMRSEVSALGAPPEKSPRSASDHASQLCA